MNERILVLAAPGLVVPLPGRTRERFSATAPRSVTPTLYIRRRLRDGDLVEVRTPPSTPSTPAKGKDKETDR